MVIQHSYSGAQLHTICDALIPHMTISGVRLLFSKKFAILVNERSHGFSMDKYNYIFDTTGFVSKS